MKAPTMKQALTDLRGTLCPCGGRKTARQTFCRGDYFRLPVGMREALYDRAGQGYEEAYGRALEFLGLSSPAAKAEAAALPGFSTINTNPKTKPTS